MRLGYIITYAPSCFAVSAPQVCCRSSGAPASHHALARHAVSLAAWGPPAVAPQQHAKHVPSSPSQAIWPPCRPHSAAGAPSPGVAALVPALALLQAGYSPWQGLLHRPLQPPARPFPPRLQPWRLP